MNAFHPRSNGNVVGAVSTQADAPPVPRTAGTARSTLASTSVLSDDVPEPPCFSLAAVLRDLRLHAGEKKRRAARSARARRTSKRSRPK